MKHIQLLSFLFLLSFLLSCKKTNPDTTSNSIKGVWELRHVVGGFGAGGNPYHAPGNGNIWKFGDSTYQFYFNGQLSDSGSYALVKDTSPATGKYMDALILNKDRYSDIFFEIKNTKLTLYRGTIALDGTMETYERIENYR